jgi:hypothetical protein
MLTRAFLLVWPLGSCTGKEASEPRPNLICLTAPPYSPNWYCPLDECLHECATQAELVDCCIHSHGLPVDEAGAMCLAQAYGMPVGIDECKVRLEEPNWIVSTIIEDECTTPNHRAGWLYYIEVSDGTLDSVRYTTYTTINTCR